MCQVTFGLRGENPRERKHSSDSTPTPTPNFPAASSAVGLQCRSPERPRCPRLTLGVTFTARSGCWRLLLLRHGPGRPVSDPAEPRSAGRPKPPLPWLHHRGAFVSRRRFARRVHQARAVPMFSSPIHCLGPPPPAVSPFHILHGRSRAMELKARPCVNGRRHFCRWRAGKRQPLIGCVRAGGGAVGVLGERASAACFRPCWALLRLISIEKECKDHRCVHSN